MGQTTEPNFVKITEIFLVPSSFLVAALGAADTNAHRAMVSALGLIISVLWWTCSREAIAELGDQEKTTRRTRVLASLPLVFAVGWLFSAIVHLMLWSRPLGH